MNRAWREYPEKEKTTERAGSFMIKMKTISFFYCLLYAAGIARADIDVEGFEGGEVSFQCSHKLAWKNNKYLCKDPCSGTEDTLVTVQSGRRASSGRITLVDSGDGVFTVTFSRLQLSDSGRYWCAVDRIGFDTFTAVHVTVKEAAANETTVMPELSPTWTYQNISISTQLTSGLDTSRPANLSTASNSTKGGEQDSSTGTVLYAAVWAVAMMITFLMLAVIGKKCRANSKPQPQVCFNSTDLVGADEREANCEYDEIGEEVQPMKTISERFSCSHHPERDPPTAAKCDVPLHIYENICCSKGTAHSRYPAANIQDKHDVSSGIYIKPLPPISECAGEGCLRKHTNKLTATTNLTSKPTESCTSDNASACHSTSCGGSTKVKPGSLWFGLDVSGTM